MQIADTAGSHINYGPYILLLLTMGFGVIGWLIRNLIASLSDLRREQNVQSSGLAVLVERVNPVTAELADHDARLRAQESGLERLRGALDNNQELTKHLISLRLGQHPGG